MRVLKPTVLHEGPPLSRQMRRPSSSQRTLLNFGHRTDTFERTLPPTAPPVKRVVSPIVYFGLGRVSQFGLIE